MSTARAHLALFTVNVIYGANYVVAKGVLGTTIGPSGFMLVRSLGALVLFWSLRAIIRERVAIGDLPRLLICGIFGVALNGTLFLHGLMRTSPVHAGILMVATPILVLVLSGVLIGERITRNKLVGILMGAGGAVLLITPRDGTEARGSSVLGDVFILINAISYALFLVLAKPLLSRYSAVTLMAWVFLIGFLLILPFGWSDVIAVPWRSLSVFELASIAFVVVMVTFVAYLLNTWALRMVNPSVVGSYIYLQPVLAVVFGLISADLPHGWSGSRVADPPSIGWTTLLSAAAIFFGVHLVSRGDRPVAGK